MINKTVWSLKGIIDRYIMFVILLKALYVSVSGRRAFNSSCNASLAVNSLSFCLSHLNIRQEVAKQSFELLLSNLLPQQWHQMTCTTACLRSNFGLRGDWTLCVLFSFISKFILAKTVGRRSGRRRMKMEKVSRGQACLQVPLAPWWLASMGDGALPGEETAGRSPCSPTGQGSCHQVWCQPVLQLQLN